MDKYSCMSIVVLIVQAAVLIAQLFFMRKTNEMTKLSERGVLLLERTPHRNDRSGMSKDLFVFEHPSQRYLLFYPNNNGLVLKSQTVRVNGENVHKSKAENSIIYPLQSDEPPARVELPVGDKELAAGEFTCEVEFLLETFANYEYVELVSMSFTREDEKYWRLSKYGTRFKT